MEKRPLKVLFLCMSCRAPLFAQQNETVKQTWGKDIIEGKYGENVELMFYDGWEHNHAYDAAGHILHVRCEDDQERTYKKSYYALKLLQDKFEYDYVFRTNTSTYVNVPLALKLIEYVDATDDSVLWTSELLALVEAHAPFPLTIYGRGNGLVMPKKVISLILKEGMSHLYDLECDDISFGKVLNAYYMKNNEDYLKHIKCFGLAWFRAVEEFEGSNNNQLCEYYNEDSSFEFMKKFVTIQIKQYYHRSDEHENYLELDKSLHGKVDESLDETLASIIEYSKNPDVFIGSILGYITYDYYVKCDKQWLWDLQCKYKADNDPWKEKYKDAVWY